MHKNTWVCLVVLVAAAACVEAATPPALQPFGFLLGEWVSDGADAGGGPSGKATFAPALQDTVMVRTSFAEYPAAGGRPATRHDDLMVIFATPGGAVEAEYWDNEGHEIRYVARSPRPGEALFLSAPRAGAPGYRLSYALGEGGVLKGEFAIAPPGSPDDFTIYLRWTARQPAGS